MEPFVGLILTLVICLIGLGLILSPLLGKSPDPLILVRPFGKWGAKIPGRFLRYLSRACLRGSRNLWRRAGRASVPGAMILGPISIVLGISGFLLSIPADILGTKGK